MQMNFYKFLLLSVTFKGIFSFLLISKSFLGLPGVVFHFSSPCVKVLFLYRASSPPSSSSCIRLLQPPPAAASCIRRIHSLCRSTWGPAFRPLTGRAGMRLPKLGGPKSCLSVTLVGGADSPRFWGRPCCCCNQPRFKYFF